MNSSQVLLFPITHPFSVRSITEADRPLVAELLEKHWGSRMIVSRDAIIDASHLPGFIAKTSAKIQGLVTYHLRGDECEVVTLDALRVNQGIGTSLLQAVENTACKLGAKTLRLVTSNDNVGALAFYQKRGFRIVAIHADALTRARTLKPQIPLTAENGIPICDEIELAKTLA